MTTEQLLAKLQGRMSRMGSEYADLRYVESERLRIRTKKGSVEEVKEYLSHGVGFRVLDKGAFGFSATWDLSESALLRHLEQARQAAQLFAKVGRRKVQLAPNPPVRAHWTMPIQKDPWAISLEEKVKPLAEAEGELLSHSWIDSTGGLLDFTRQKIVFISSEGSRIEQILYRSGGFCYGESWIEGTGEHERIRRHAPGPSGLYRAQGFEAIESFHFPHEAIRLAEELRELRKAPEAPSGTFDLILKSSVLALQIHETFGHASEADRLFGYEDNFGGRTFLKPELLSGTQVASDKVNIVSDAGMSLGPGAGSFVYDDEGVSARKIDVVRNGIFSGYLTSRETAYFLNQPRSSGNMVARDWSYYPLIRMTNLSLLPGAGMLEELISGVQDGFILDNELSWSIDEMRGDFEIGAEAGYRIRGGQVTGLVRFPVYRGRTIDFWRSCDQVAGESEWSFWGFADCGKGGPVQEIFTGHGVSPARFRNVQFGRK